MNKEMTTKSDNFLAPLMEKNAWGQAPQLSPKDIIIPRILLMQGQSDKVLAGEATFGDLRDSVSNEVLGGPKKPLEIIPFSMKKAIIVSEYEPKTKKHIFKEVLEATPENENLPWEEGTLKRTRVLSFFVLIPDEIKKGGAIPKLISFRSTSMDAAKVIATQMYAINGSAQPWLPPPAFVMTLSVRIDKNDKGTFAVLEARKGRKSTDEEVQVAHSWFESINAGQAKVDEAHDEPPVATTAANAKDYVPPVSAGQATKKYEEPKGF